MQAILVKKCAAFFLIAAALCSLFTGCTKENLQPADTIVKLQSAINTFDTDSLLQCIDSRWAEQIETLLSFPVRHDGMSAKTFLTMIKTVMPALPFVSDGLINPNDMPQIECTVLKTDITDGTAVVALSGTLTCGEWSRLFAATVDMKLENDVWVICGIR